MCVCVWKKQATLALTKGYQTSRKFLSRIADHQTGQAHVERVRLWTVCLLTELVDFLDTRSKLDEAYDLVKNEPLATTDILLCAKGLHIGIRIGRDKPEVKIGLAFSLFLWQICGLYRLIVVDQSGATDK